MIINNDGYNDDDNNNNTFNNWHEEQSRQKVLLLGNIIRNILCTSCHLIWVDTWLLWSVKLLFWAPLESVDVVRWSWA